MSMRVGPRTAFALFLLLLAAPAIATVRYEVWWKEKGSSSKNVAAFDLSSGKVIWQKLLPDSANFAVERPEGVLVGCDDGYLYLLKPESGVTIWRLKLGKEVNEFHDATEEGVLVSHDKQVYWLIGADGMIKATWR